MLEHIDVWKFISSLLVSLAVPSFAWYMNERRKRAWEEYTRKEQHYRALIVCLKGFYASGIPAEQRVLKSEFIDQLNLCWLYAPDEVIKAGYAFLDSVHTDSPRPDAMKETALGALVVAIRRDLLNRALVRKTGFGADSFRLTSAT